MKRYIPHITTTLVLISLLIGGFGHVTHAVSTSSVAGLIFGGNYAEFITEIVALLVNLSLTLSSWMLTVSGYLLNLSISLTMHIKQFVDGTPAIYTVWKSIRDISGMFIIFTLLIAAIKMILSPVGIPGPNVGNLIKTVVVAGILINFSFFLAGLGIDASNIVSMQLYNAIAPANNLNSTSFKLDAKTITSEWDGGISDIFMQSLRITSLYDTKTGKLSDTGNKSNISAPLKIILIGIAGSIIIITAAISFFLASLAFIVRFVILLFLLAFSPIWFASFAVPKLDDYAKKWTKNYMNQLLFMPAYLLLMYFAMTVLTSNTLFGSGYAGNLSGSDTWYSNFLVLAINAALVIVMLNAPLLAALSLGAFMPKWANSAGADAIWKKVGGWTRSATIGTAGVGAGIAARHTLGTGAMALDKKLGNTRFFGDTVIGRDIRSATTGSIAKNKFGTVRSAEDYAKESSAAKRQGAVITRNNDFNIALKNAQNNTPPIIGKTLKDTLEKMGEKGKLSLGAKQLSDPQVIKHLKKTDFEAIKKSDDFSEEEKLNISTARKNEFEKAINSNDSQTIKDMIRNYDSNDIAGMDESILSNPQLVEHLTNENLKKIADSSVSSNTKHAIATTILNWHTIPANQNKHHRAFGYIDKNKNEWI